VARQRSRMAAHAGVGRNLVRRLVGSADSSRVETREMTLGSRESLISASPRASSLGVLRPSAQSALSGTCFIHAALNEYVTGIGEIRVTVADALNAVNRLLN
jgi:hypothetical protein